MMKILLALLPLAMMTGAASAQSQTLHDANGKVVGRSATDGRTTTLYDANGKVIIRESKTGNTTTIYDASGRNVGRYSTNPKR
jgi:YD repeat-containing protein